MWFGHPTNDWYRGKVISIVNGKTDRVKIVWDKEGLHEADSIESTRYLTKAKYIPESTREGA